jgi:hypothetical protein
MKGRRHRAAQKKAKAAARRKPTPTVEVFSQVASCFEGNLFAETAAMAIVSKFSGAGWPRPDALLVHHLTLSFRQPFVRFREIFDKKIHYLAGRPSWTGSLARLFARENVMANTLRDLAVNSPGDRPTVDFAAANPGPPEGSNGPVLNVLKAVSDVYRAEECELRSVGSQTCHQGMAVSQSVAVGFTNLESSRPKPTSLDHSPEVGDRLLGPKRARTKSDDA